QKREAITCAVCDTLKGGKTPPSQASPSFWPPSNGSNSSGPMMRRSGSSGASAGNAAGNRLRLGKGGGVAVTTRPQKTIVSYASRGGKALVRAPPPPAAASSFASPAPALLSPATTGSASQAGLGASTPSLT
ncbi:unnamed protein product, partial [Discosporangium mesarthrocarpum]